MKAIAKKANVEKSHLYSCIGDKAEPSFAVRHAFEATLGFDPWSDEIRSKDGKASTTNID